jgi:DNA-binding PadR family transcriptional regulator
MAVLCDVEVMSRNTIYGGWCIKSKDKMAEWLDLSRDTIFRSLKALLDKGYLDKNEEINGYRPSAYIYQIMNCQEIAVLLRNKDFSLISANFNELVGNKPQSDSASEKKTTIVAKSDGDSSKIRLPQSEIQTQDIHLDIQLDRQIDIDSEKSQFETFRESYSGTKRGLDTEFQNFKKHRDWKVVLQTLMESYNNQQSARSKAKENGQFVPQMPNLQTYINQRRWEEEFVVEAKEQPKINQMPKVQSNKTMAGKIIVGQ